MIADMPSHQPASPFRLGGPSTVELALCGEHGAPWVLTLSAGMEKFIGPYPRIDGFDAGGPLIVFRATGLPA
jgi:hypothetical protein